MIDPTRHRQLQELDVVGLCTRILQNSRNELYLNMRYLDLSLSSLGFEMDPACRGLGTDGFVIYYHGEYLCDLYRRGRVLVNRAYLHMVLHCLFCHMDTMGRRDGRMWNLACDIAAESVIDGLYLKCVHIQTPPFRMDWYGRLRQRLQVLNAEGVYKALEEMKLTERQLERLEAEFLVDDHQYWQLPPDAPKTGVVRQNQWSNNREKLQTEMETMGNRQDEDTKSLLEQVQVENRSRYDYRRFLQKFSVLREEMLVDEDSFDYVFYTYGLSLYGNMPLVEPLESKEVSRIEDFVLVIDTSMSCSGDLVRRFLEETYSVLSESESFFRRIHVHILQCDEKIQSDVVIENAMQLKEYMSHFTVKGGGGTDFRPAFAYVEQLMRAKKFTKLRGLIYFTDGYGIYPAKMPPYETAFVFMKEDYQDIDVPPWAIRLILDEEDLESV